MFLKTWRVNATQAPNWNQERFGPYQLHLQTSAGGDTQQIWKPKLWFDSLALKLITVEFLWKRLNRLWSELSLLTERQRFHAFFNHRRSVLPPTGSSAQLQQHLSPIRARLKHQPLLLMAGRGVTLSSPLTSDALIKARPLIKATLCHPRSFTLASTLTRAQSAIKAAGWNCVFIFSTQLVRGLIGLMKCSDMFLSLESERYALVRASALRTNRRRWDDGFTGK